MKVLGHIITILVALLAAQVASATDYQRTGSGMSFSWQSTDYVGVYTTGGTIVKYYPSTTSGNTATMSSGFGLSTGTQYYAYSPYNKDNWDKAMTALPITYLNQSQQGNSSTAHLGTYDYQMASFTTGSAAASISFRHLGAVLHLSWTLPVDAKATRLKLTCLDGKPFATEATMNLSTQTVSTTATADTLSLALQVVTQSKGDVLNAYMMMLPTDLTGKKLKAQLFTSTGKVITAYINGTMVRAGYIYPLYIGNDNVSVNSRQNVAAAPKMASQTTISSVTATSQNFSVDTSNAFTVLYEGDVNSDKKVDIGDVATLVSVMKGASSTTYSPDVNHDGNVNSKDISRLVDILFKRI